MRALGKENEELLQQNKELVDSLKAAVEAKGTVKASAEVRAAGCRSHPSQIHRATPPAHVLDTWRCVRVMTVSASRWQRTVQTKDGEISKLEEELECLHEALTQAKQEASDKSASAEDSEERLKKNNASLAQYQVSCKI